MQLELRAQNEDLLREINAILRSIAAVSVPEQLEPYRQCLTGILTGLVDQIDRNLANLNVLGVNILPEILDQTSVVTRELYVLNDRYLGPLLRSRPTDRLPLKLLTWTHESNTRTCNLPVAFSDGSFGSWPDDSSPTLYVIPPGGQERLLHLPLCFHEFGHLLYACHQNEMDDLVKDLQKAIAKILEPLSRRNDKQSQIYQRKRKLIAERWYDWAQEFFCDAVGLIMGGPAFAYSFSFYFRTIGQDAYRRSYSDQMRNEHPVTWLRIHVLADQARSLGWQGVGDQIEKEWQDIASTWGVDEDYFGCYDKNFLPHLRQALNDMLTEADPRVATPEEIAYDGVIAPSTSPPALLNLAWRRVEAGSLTYPLWEAQAVTDWITP